MNGKCIAIRRTTPGLLDNGIENAILMKPQTPETLLEEKQLREQLYAGVTSCRRNRPSGSMPGIIWVCV